MQALGEYAPVEIRQLGQQRAEICRRVMKDITDRAIRIVHPFDRDFALAIGV
jgi:hypothetical protein